MKRMYTIKRKKTFEMPCGQTGELEPALSVCVCHAVVMMTLHNASGRYNKDFDKASKFAPFCICVIHARPE